MAEDTRGWIVQPNPSAQDEEGNFGAEQWAYRRPGDHLMVFSGESADGAPPSQTAQEHLEASNYEEPQSDSVSAAAEVEARNQDQGTA